jgi:hypothetical protein
LALSFDSLEVYPKQSGIISFFTLLPTVNKDISETGKIATKGPYKTYIGSPVSKVCPICEFILHFVHSTFDSHALVQAISPYKQGN